MDRRKRAFFDERPPFAPFSALVRRDPFRRVYRIREAAWARALRALPLTRGERVLDVGGWSGIALDQLAALRGTRAVCADLSLRGLAEARDEGVAVRPVRADARALPFPDGAFDAVVSFDMLEHVLPWPDAVAEMARVARPGGHLVLSAVSARWRFTWAWWESKLVDVFSYAGHDPAMYVDPDELARVLRESGARVLRTTLINPFATLIFDQSMMVLALGVDRYAPPLRRPFLAVATALRVAFEPLLRVTEVPWLLFGRSNSVLVVARREP